MFISDVSIRRPVFTTMLNLILIVFGLFALPRLGVDQMPNVDFPVVTVSVLYPGADPQSIEQRILDPLENAVNGISGLEKLMSNAYPNLAQLVLQFKLEKNSDQAAQEVRDKVFAAVGQLPNEAETPIVQKFDIGGAPIINISLSGDGVPFGELSRLAKDVVKPALERVPGVAAVNSAGIRERQVQIYIDRGRLASFGLTPADVINSVQQQNMDLPAGKIQNDASYWTLRVKGKLANGDQVASLPIISNVTTNLKLSDVAEVKDVIAEEDSASFVGRDPTILMSIQKQAGGNTTSIADEARANIAKLASQMPKGTKLEIVSDNSIYIKGSIDSVKLDLVLGAVLATIIVLIFLRDFRITLISAVALPTAVIATFAFLDYMGFTLNMMSTLGLSLSIGILIDDAIIVIENIHRHLAMNKTGEQAAKDATSEIGLAVLATTLTICAVFVPVAFMEGIIGRFFYQFGLTVTFAVLVSLFVAFTLSPMLSARFLKEGETEPKFKPLAKFFHATAAMLDRVDDAYRKILTWCLDHRKITLAMGAATFVLSIVLLRFVPVAFFPKEDRSQFNISYKLPEGTTLDVTKKKSLEISDKLRAIPGVDKVITAIGATAQKKPNVARFDVLLVPVAERSYSQDDIVQQLRRDFAPEYNQGETEFVISDGDGGGGGGHSQPIQLIFKSNNWEALVAYTDKVREHVSKNIAGAVDVTTSKPKVQREYRIEVDPARAADLAVSTAQIATALRALFEGDKVSEIEDTGSTFDVRMRIADQDRTSIEDLTAITINNRRGEQITLGALANIRLADAPSYIERFDGQRQITVLSNFSGKDLNKASTDIQAFVASSMPPDITLSLSGQTEIMMNAIKAMLKALGLAVLLVFMILCAQYERYLAPLVIMAALPLSLTGAFGSLLITQQVMSVYTMIGIILLMGLVTKNGILLIDFTMQRINDGLSVKDALLEAGPIRLRPILMTTFAAGGGMLPVAIGHGVGGEARSPMGVAVIGGLLMSTVLTLVVVPCAFSLVEDLRARIAARVSRRRSGQPPAASGSRNARKPA
jgi:HAE1 family hydrophobic/amphiphilic exporter-1